MGREVSYRLLAAIRVAGLEKQQAVRQRDLVLGNLREAGQLFAVDDRGVEAGLRRVVEKDRIEDLATGRRQPKADVRDTENGL